MSNKNKLQAWILVLRLKTLWAAIVPVLIAGIMSLEQGSREQLTLIVILLSAICIQVISNLVNDWRDFVSKTDDQDRLGPKRSLQLGLLNENEIKIGIVVTLSLAILLGAYLVYQGGVIILVIGLMGLFSAFWYSAGKFSLANTGLSEIFVFLFFGPVATIGTYYLLTGTYSYQALIAGIAPGLLSTLILIANNLRDFDNDQKAGRKTLAVRLGIENYKLFYIASIAAALLIPCLLTSFENLRYNLELVLIVFAWPAIMQVLSGKEGKDFVSLLPKSVILLQVYLLIFLIT